jgi:hypothetical protein
MSEENIPKIGLESNNSLPTEISGPATANKAPDEIIDELASGLNAENLDDEALDQRVDKHPFIKELTASLNAKRHSGEFNSETEKSAIEEIRRERKNISDQIKRKLGITEEDPEQHDRQLETERLRKLGAILSTLNFEENDDELLAKFGIIDSNGNMTSETMNSPLFKEDTRVAFNTYLHYVKQFEAFQEAEQIEGHAVRNIEQADKLRVEAHDAVAQLVARDLNLPYELARRFVAKSRDEIIPGANEKSRYATLLRGQKLAEQFGHDALAITEEYLRGVIKEPMPHEKE